MARPVYRLVAKSKETGAYLEIGAVWPSKIPGAFNVTFHEESNDERKMAVLKKGVTNADFFFNLFEVRDKQEGQAPSKPYKKPVQSEDVDF